MTSAGRYIAIRIDRNAFEEFFKEKASGLTRRSIAAKAGITENTLYVGLRQQRLSLQNIEKIAKAFDITMWNLPFITDEAYTISFKLTTNLDIYWRARMIYQIRGLLADGVPQDKVRDIVLSDILAGKYTRGTQSDSESKACMASTPVLVEPDPSSIVIDVDETTPIPPNGMQNKRLYVESASDTEAYHTSVRDAEKRLRLRELLMNSDPQIKNKFIMNVGRISNMERYLRDRERTTAQALSQEIVKYLVSCSENRRPKPIEDLDRMDNIINLHGKWSAMHESCEHLHIYVKKRTVLDTVYFFIVHGEFLMGFDAKYVDDIKLRLYEDVEFIGRYPIKTDTNTDGDEACEKEEE